MSSISSIHPPTKPSVQNEVIDDSTSIVKILFYSEGRCYISASNDLSYENMLLRVSVINPSFTGDVHKICNFSETVLIGSIG